MDANVLIFFREYPPSKIFSAVPVFPATSYPSTLANVAVPSFVVTIFLNIVTRFVETFSSKILSPLAYFSFLIRVGLILKPPLAIVE